MKRGEPRDGPGELVLRGADVDRLYYVQARLRSRMAQRLRGEDYERLLGMTLDQVAHALSERAYGEEARALGLAMAGGGLLREMLRRRLSAEIAELRRMCGDGALGNWLRAWNWKYDLALLLAALRARGRSAVLPPGVLCRLAQLPREVYQAVIVAPRLADVLDPLSDSPFRKTLELAASDSPPEPDLIEVGLLHDFYDTTISSLWAAVPDGDPARRILENEVHAVNLLAVLAARDEGLEEKRTMAQLIPRGFWTSEPQVLGLLKAADGAELAGRLAEMGHAEILGSLVVAPGAEVTPGALERAAARAALHEARLAARSGRPTPAALLGHLALLESEARNVMALVLAAEGGVDRDQTRAMLVA